MTSRQPRHPSSRSSSRSPRKGGAKSRRDLQRGREFIVRAPARYFPSRYNIYEAMHHDQQWLITPSSKKNHPRCPPARARSLAVPERRVNASPACTRACTSVRARARARYPRAISYRRPSDNSYLGEAVFLPTSDGGGMPGSGPCSRESRERSTAAYLSGISVELVSRVGEHFEGKLRHESNSREKWTTLSPSAQPSASAASGV